MTPEPSKEEPKGVAPSSADLEKAKEILPDCYNDSRLLRQRIAKALAEVRAEGERKLAIEMAQTEDARSLALKLEAEKSALEKEKAGLEERVKIIEQDRDSWRRCAERLETEKTEPKLTINIEESAIKELFKNQAEELTRLKSRNEELEARYDRDAKAFCESENENVQLRDRISRLTSALARAHEALDSAREVLSYLGTLNSGKCHEIMVPDDDEPVLPQRKEWVDFIVPLNEKVFARVKEALADKDGTLALERWKAMEAVVEAAKNEVSQSECFCLNAPDGAGKPICEYCQLKKALGALDAKGGVSE